MKAASPVQDLLTARELAQRAGVHAETVARLVRAGKISPAAMTLSRIKLFHYSAVSTVAFIAGNPKLRAVLY